MSADHAQRAADLAAATAEHDALAAQARETPPATEAEAFAHLRAIGAARARIRRLRPHTLRWRVTLAGGGAVAVETRDKSDWVSDASDETCVVGAFAEVPWCDPTRPQYRETECSHYDTAWRDEAGREADHRAAVDRLCEINGWVVADVARDGERWEP